MSKNEQSHKEKPVSELLQEQSKELKTYIDTKHREMEELLAESEWQAFPSSCENIPAVRRSVRRSVRRFGRRSAGQHLSESESAKVDGNDLKP